MDASLSETLKLGLNLKPYSPSINHDWHLNSPYVCVFNDAVMSPTSQVIAPLISGHFLNLISR